MIYYCMVAMLTISGVGTLCILTLCLLITTIIIFNLFYQPIKSLSLAKKCVSKHPRFSNVCAQIKQILVIFNHLEVVDRGSETQLQVGENVNDLT